MEDYKPWGMDKKPFLMLMHLSQLSGLIIPLAGLLVPVIMWVTNRQSSVEIDDHGKVIMNWIFSTLIYSAISLALTLVLVGVIGFFIIGICTLVFTIMGAVKANDGILWEYPLSIKFYKINTSH